MNFLRRHPYLITLAALLVVLPVPAFAIGEDIIFPLVTSVLGLFVRLAAMLLNFSINYFVIDFGGVYAKTGVGYAVDTTWIIIRDFVNMGFIFGFVYIGFKMILNSNDSNTRRWLVNLLLAALLVNFSLFAAKFVVDFSNQMAAQIVVNGLNGEYTTNKTTGLAEVDLGQSFMDRMGITSVWENPPQGAGWGYIFGSAILFMITTFVFAAGGILLIIRFAVLNLFLVLSPLMFLSWVIPGIKDTMNRYWSGFLGRAFFAPIYLLFIYFSLQLISGLQVAVGSNASNLANPSWAGTFQAVEASGARSIQDSTLGTLPIFVLICVFMIASLVIAQKMGADGGDRAVAMGKQLRNKVQRGVTRTAGGATFGVGARIGRNTLGKYAQNYSDSDVAKARASNSYLGKLAYNASAKVGGASFDARRVGEIGKQLGIGEGVAGGYAKRIKDAKEAEKKFYGKDGLGFVDIDKGEGKSKVEAITATYLEQAEEKKAKANMEAAEFEKDQLQSEVTLTEAINALSEEIKTKELALEDSVSKGTLTDKERTEAEKALNIEKQRLEAKRINLESVKVKDAALIARNKLNRVNASGTASEQEKALARQEFQEAEKAHSTAYANRTREIEASKKEAEKERNNAETRAKAEVKYERQIAYMGQLEKQKNRLGLLGQGGAAVGGGVLGGIAAGLGGAGFYGIAAGTSARAKSAELAAIIKDIDKEFGEGGVKTIKKEKSKENAKALVDAINEDAGKTEGDKKPEEDKK